MTRIYVSLEVCCLIQGEGCFGDKTKQKKKDENDEVVQTSRREGKEVLGFEPGSQVRLCLDAGEGQTVR